MIKSTKTTKTKIHCYYKDHKDQDTMLLVELHIGPIQRAVFEVPIFEQYKIVNKVKLSNEKAEEEICQVQ